MHEVGDMVLPALKGTWWARIGPHPPGTVEGDIHYIGKDIIKVLLDATALPYSTWA